VAISRRGFLMSAAAVLISGAAGALYAILRGGSAGGRDAREPLSETAANLRAALARERSSAARYAAFAAAAEAEGYRGIAALFRAAARAEEIHSELYAGLIGEVSVAPAGRGEDRVAAAKEIGGASAATAENLRVAADEQKYEYETLYKSFWEKAREERNKEAVEAFNYDRTVAGELASMFLRALKDTSWWKEGRIFYVCSVCGRVQTELKGSQCTLCFADNSKFVRVE
jgi:rubrerythrin